MPAIRLTESNSESIIISRIIKYLAKNRFSRSYLVSTLPNPQYLIVSEWIDTMCESKMAARVSDRKIGKERPQNLDF
jgi:hypothetical protein